MSSHSPITGVKNECRVSAFIMPEDRVAAMIAAYTPGKATIGDDMGREEAFLLKIRLKTVYFCKAIIVRLDPRGSRALASGCESERRAAKVAEEGLEPPTRGL